jgi:hypothetical protein
MCGCSCSLVCYPPPVPGSPGRSELAPTIAYPATSTAANSGLRFGGGFGNLVLGYDEDPGGHPPTGSHNLILGEEQTFTSYGGIDAGFLSTISGPFASVTGGLGNTASGKFASVSGGASNTAEGEFSSVSGGYANSTKGTQGWVGGGSANVAIGLLSSVSGGEGNKAEGEWSSILGGQNNVLTTKYGEDF